MSGYTADTQNKHAQRLLFPLGCGRLHAVCRRQAVHLWKFHTVYVIKHAQFTISYRGRTHLSSATVYDYLDLRSFSVVRILREAFSAQTYTYFTYQYIFF